jgi:hypothetical protein
LEGNVIEHALLSTTIEARRREQTASVGVMGWRFLWGIDFGFSHPFAAALCAVDDDTEVFYVLRTLRIKGGVPIIHAAAMRDVACNVPIAWPHDGTQTQKGDGEELVELYRKQTLNMLRDHATHVTGGIGVELGLAEMDNAMLRGKFKVLDTCDTFFDEFRSYRRIKEKDGSAVKILKVKDDVLDAVRYCWMMRRYAKRVALGNKRIDPGRRPQIAEGADEEHFGY